MKIREKEAALRKDQRDIRPERKARYSDNIDKPSAFLPLWGFQKMERNS